ncbi:MULTISPECIES: DUF6471 domain-containing protein [unclassified Caballeronia]|uniref:DUF6471 domain-containing protein n=1 Tax=unclassified Caballeronia TaxID=2646786 RepID=UPI0015890FC9|nr:MULTISPECIES: DUF6471 domain-containing protein [unclassified Caballeronia]QSN63475.1 hypothetical protein JYK05_14695 [Caballeronia sp. M1242]
MSKRPNAVPETDNVYEEWEEEARELIVSKMNELKLSFKELALRLERLGVVESAGQLNRKINRKRFSAAFMLACLDAMEEETSS